MKESLLDNIEASIEEKLGEALAKIDSEAEPRLERNEASEEGKGEFASPVAFEIGSRRGEEPGKVAEDILEVIDEDIDFVERVELISGYINFFLDRKEYAREIVNKVNEQKDGYGHFDGDRLAVIDESSPNIAKPMHVGHLRNTLLADSLNEILRNQGYSLITDNHLGDWGGQFGNLMHAYDKWGDEEKFEEDPIGHLLDLYQRFGQLEADIDNPHEVEELRDEGREWFQKLEDGDEKALELWKKFRDVSIERFEETYNRLEIEFDEWIGESFYVQEGWTDKIVDKALSEGVAEKRDDGSVVAKVGKPDPETGERRDFVILKSDGTTLYATRDLGTIMYREEEWDPDEILYVVASEQDEYFKDLFETAEQLGFNSDKYTHVSYGMLSLPEGSMSTRRGRIITAREILEEAREKAYQMVEENMPDKGGEKKDEIAEKIALAAVRYENIKVSRERDIVFDKDEALAFEGQTGPYLQYSLTRAENILEESNEEAEFEPIELDEAAYRLVDKLARYPSAMERSADKYDPSEVAMYTYRLSNLFNTFYHECPVNQADEEAVRKTRRSIVRAYIQVMQNALRMLRIDPVEEM